MLSPEWGHTELEVGVGTDSLSAYLSEYNASYRICFISTICYDMHGNSKYAHIYLEQENILVMPMMTLMRTPGPAATFFFKVIIIII